MYDSVENIFNRLEEINKSEAQNNESKERAKITLNKLNSVCAVSLILFFEFSKRALNFKSIIEAYKIDKKLFKKICFEETSDFSEGIRALLVDKDKDPKWKYKTIFEIKIKKKLLNNILTMNKLSN